MKDSKIIEDKLRVLLKNSNNIKYVTERVRKWQDIGTINYEEKTIDQLEKQFKNCCANNLLTFLSNVFTNLNLTDMEVGLKAFKSDKILKLNLKEKRFGFEPEVTIKLAKQKCIFYEIGISYRGRTYEEGKKIGLLDAFAAIYCIIRYSIFD